MRQLRADALSLEPLLERHAVEMYDLLIDPAIYEFENAPPDSLAALQRRYSKLEARSSPDGTQQWLNWVIALPEGNLAGYVQATVLLDGHAYVAYELASKHWRKGIASAALRLVLPELVNAYSVRTAFAVLKAANYRSRGLLTKLGFTPHAAGLAPWPSDPEEVTMSKALRDAGDAA